MTESKRSHIEIGESLDLFMQSPYSPGDVFFLPHGTRIYKSLENMIRKEYKQKGYDEVITPQIANVELWEISGHWQNYKENMFSLEDPNFALKPMNCPMHCLIYKSQSRSYRNLPIRYADFGCLHRNESSGSLRGLTRVRKFCQDDAHIFCSPDQIQSEIEKGLQFLDDVYKVLGFDYSINLSTKPDKFMGDISVWENAERSLIEALGERPYVVKEKDGAFYGPKLDISVKDYCGREYQCGTIQLDFQLPEKFDLHYVSESGLERPVIIHRAILGSLERMMAILIEKYQGRLPLFLSPRQFILLPLNNSEEIMNYCNKIKENLFNFFVDIDDSQNTLQYKIRNAEMKYYNNIIIIGKKEVSSNQVSVRMLEHSRKDDKISFDEFIRIFNL